MTRSKTMKKRMCLVTAFMVLLCALLVAGCGQKPIPHTELASRLGSIKGGASPDAPSTVKIAPVNIMAVWSDINKAVYTAGKYLILDLSACSVPENAIDDNFGEVIQDNEYLKGIILPDSLTSIGRGAFWGCSNLASVTIPAVLTAIDPGAFSGCTSLSAITIAPANTAFASEDGVLFSKDKTTLLIYSNGKGTSYTIPNSVTSIGERAFSGSSLTSVTIPDSVTSIGDSAFFGSGLTSIIIPDSVTSIGGATFYECWNLTSITIPTSVTSIGEAAFNSCSLFSITIPASVTSIGTGAFYRCSDLTSVTFEAESISFGSFPFNGNLRDMYLAGGAGTYTAQYGGAYWTKQ